MAEKSSVEFTAYNVADAIQKGADLGLQVIAMKVTAEAKALAPVDNGPLRNSIMWKRGDSQGGFNDSPKERAEKQITPEPRSNEAFIGSNIAYAVYQEFGTRYMAPQPFLRPAIALYAKGRNAEAVLKDILKEQNNGTLKQTAVEKRVKFF